MTRAAAGLTLDIDALQVRAAHPQSATPRPFLRWAGSKRALVRHIVPHLPKKFRRYWEPFAGSASLFFLLRPHQAVLSDACHPLIDTYAGVRDDVEAVLTHLGTYRVSKEDFYAARAQQPRDATEQAARFIYLNKTAWNGLYRVNANGVFNVPYGRPKTNNLIDPFNLRECAALLARTGVRLSRGDFEDSLTDVGEGDLVFLDPPYVTGHNNNGFVDYNKQLFSWADQKRLAATARRLVQKGAHVLVTNADHHDVLALYPSFNYISLERSSTLASDKSKRRSVREALLVGKPV